MVGYEEESAHKVLQNRARTKQKENRTLQCVVRRDGAISKEEISPTKASSRNRKNDCTGRPCRSRPRLDLAKPRWVERLIKHSRFSSRSTFPSAPSSCDLKLGVVVGWGQKKRDKHENKFEIISGSNGHGVVASLAPLYRTEGNSYKYLQTLFNFYAKLARAILFERSG